MKFDCSNKHYLIILSIFQIAFLDERGLRNPNCTVRSRCCYLFSRFIKSHRYVCGHYVLQFWYVCSHYFCSSLLVSVVITYVLQCWYVCGHYQYLFSSVLVYLWSLLIFFSTDWFEGPLAQIQVKFPWQLILMIQLTPYNLNPRLLQPCTINSS